MNNTTKTIWAILLFLVLGFASVTPAYALNIDVHVPEKYTDVEAGERFYFEIEIKYPENPSRKDLRLEYVIKKDDEVIAESKLLKAVETQASFMDFIVIPEGAEKGLHTINVKVADYEDLSEEISASFQVVDSKGNQLKLYFFILLGAIILIGGFVSWELFHLLKKRR